MYGSGCANSPSKPVSLSNKNTLLDLGICLSRTYSVFTGFIHSQVPGSNGTVRSDIRTVL